MLHKIPQKEGKTVAIGILDVLANVCRRITRFMISLFLWLGGVVFWFRSLKYVHHNDKELFLVP